MNLVAAVGILCGTVVLLRVIAVTDRHLRESKVVHLRAKNQSVDAAWRSMIESIHNQ